MISFVEKIKYIKNNEKDLSSFIKEFCKGNSSKQNSSFCNSDLKLDISMLSIHQIDLIYEYLSSKNN